MTAAELLTDPLSDLHGFIDQWEREGRAFLGFADWFEEQGMAGQARAWAWCAKQPDRWTDTPTSYDGRELGGMMPYRSYVGSGYAFCKSEPRNFRQCIPQGLCSDGGFCRTYAEAIASFLDSWAEVFGDSAVPLELVEKAA